MKKKNNKDTTPLVDENTVQDQNNENTRKKRKRNKILRTAYIAVVHVLGISAIVGLSVALYYSEDRYTMQMSYQRQMDAAYSRAYYDLLDGSGDLEVKLRKLSVAGNPETQQSLLYEVWGVACLAENNLGLFESADEGLMKAQKCVNQLGDYAHSLAKGLNSNRALSAEEKQKLAKLSTAMGALKRSLAQVQQGLDNGELFVSDKGGIAGDFSAAFGEFSNPSFEYPEMIYDGPFSDALNKRETKGLSGKEITSDEGAAALKKYLGENVANVEFIGEGGGNIRTYSYSLSVGGEQAYAQISKQGGRLIAFNGAFGGEKVSDARVEAHQSCQNAAINFAKNAGYDNMQVVWSASVDGTCLVNLAPVENGIILYPDLVKVKVDENSNTVTGFDSTHHAFNHRPRKLAPPTLNEESAREGLNIPPVSQGRLTLIPLNDTQEVLTYEYECESDGTYFVYIDANTGKEANILYVVDDEGGIGQSLI